MEQASVFSSMESGMWSSAEVGARIREDVNLPLKDIVFQNIHFVSSTVHATRDLVDSIEKDVMDIRSAIREREQSKVDQQQLIALLRMENRTLKEKVELLEIELDRVEQDAATELEERLSSLQAEMQRIAQQCSEALSDRNELALQLNHLEAQNSQLVTENQYLHNQLQEQATAAEANEASLAADPIRQQLETITSRVAVLEAEAEVSRALHQSSSSSGFDAVIAHPSAVSSPTSSAPPVPLTLDSRYLVQESASMLGSASRGHDVISPNSLKDDEDDEAAAHLVTARNLSLRAHHLTHLPSRRYGSKDSDDDTFYEEDRSQQQHQWGGGRPPLPRTVPRAMPGWHGHSHGLDLEEPVDGFEDIQLADVLTRDFR